MYIYLDNSLKDIDFEDESSSDFLDKICDFINKSFRGKFIIDGKFFLKKLSSLGLGFRTESKIKFIINRNLEYKDFYDSSVFKIIVYHQKALKEDSNAIYIDFETFINYEFNQIDFIAEDMNDAEFVEQIIRIYKIVNKIDVKFVNSFNVINGGGANTPRMYDYHIKQNKNFVVCFCDSDKFSPAGNYGENARKCSRISKNTFSKFFTTYGREIENDIPIEIIRNCFSSDVSTLKRINLLSSYENYICAKILKYADLKKGVSNIWVEKMNSNSENGRYWGVCQNVIYDLIWFSYKYNSKNYENEYILLPYISENILKNVTAYLKKMCDDDLLQVINSINYKKDNNSSSLYELSEKLYWITYSFKPEKFVA
jgi:hypothetical protein